LDRPPTPRGSAPRRRWLLWLGGTLLALVVALGALSGFYVDVLWFREVGYSNVFWTIFWSRIFLAAAFGALFFVLLYANLLIARAIRPRYQVFAPGEEAVERYRVVLEPYTRWLLLGVSILLALFAAAGVAAQWEAFQQWRAAGSVSFGVTDPVFGRDVSFHALALPFHLFIQSWLFSSLVAVTVVTAAAYYLWGGIRFRAVAERVTPQVKAHLSVLLGLIVLVRAWGYRLGQFDLLLSPRGTVTGASYTDINAQLPALQLLVVISIIVTVLFLVNIRFRGWALPAIGLGLLVLTSVLAGAVWPAAIQRLRVDPQELQREREFIARNIEFTRRAYGLDRIESQSFAAEPELSPEELEVNRATVEDIRLWNPAVLRSVYHQLQRIRPYYEFVDVDVDRYEIDGERVLTMIAPREINQDNIQGGGQTWQNRHLVYTHGYGVAVSRADQLTTSGTPRFLLRDIPPAGELSGTVEQPRVYFGESSDVPYLLVNTDQRELDFPVGSNQFARTNYQGEGGIEVSGLFRRLAFAWRYRDVNLLISGLVNEDSRILINTDVPTRVPKIAPFLSYDHDPYPAIVDGRVVWIWDAYTTTDRYPYSEIIDLAGATADNLRGRANYIRNSVKVVVDAYEGTTTFYLIDEEDPLVQAWAQVFPDLFTPLEEASPELREHFRYPEDMFLVQATQFANYHVTAPGQFYLKEDFWAVPIVAQDPEIEPRPLEPYYVLLPVPGEESAGERFMLFIPFTPADRPNMVAWMAAVSDPDEYGRMLSFEFPLERNVPGPQNVAAFISQETDIAREVSLLDQLGSNVIYGDLLAIPVGRSFLYVQPLYLESSQAESAIPELQRVVVVNGDTVVMEPTLEEALASAFGLEEEEPEEPTDPEEPTEPGEPVPQTIQELLAEAQRHFDLAQAALERGNLGEYQREIDLAEEAIAAAVEASGLDAGS